MPTDHSDVCLSHPAASTVYDVEVAIHAACYLDVVAFKPGNVSLAAAGHGMTANDFIASANVSASLLAAPNLAVGARVEGAVSATFDAVGCNTNLGIALLIAPLVGAAYIDHDGSLEQRLHAVLDELTLADSRAVFNAIRRAHPAGLGAAEREDVNQAPSLNLLAVMRLAAGRDRIAHQYAHNYVDIFTLGIPRLTRTIDKSGSLTWAMVNCYFGFLTNFRDSHIERKHGAAVAERVMARALTVETSLKACENRPSRVSMLQKFDNELKGEGVNPGTSADLTVASMLALALTCLEK